MEQDIKIFVEMSNSLQRAVRINKGQTEKTQLFTPKLVWFWSVASH